MIDIPKNALNVIGKTYGKQLGLQFTGKKTKGNNFIWLWKCLSCDNEYEQPSGNIVHRKNEKCPRCCHTISSKYGFKKGGLEERTYRIWQKMLSRAHYKSPEYVQIYKNVSICKSWVDTDVGFTNFWKDMGTCPSEIHSINRKRSCNLYSKDTCEWSTPTDQCYDRKTMEKNKTGVRGVVWRGHPRNVWQAHLKYNKKWTRYYYGNSYNDACICRVIAELLTWDFSHTLEDFSKNGLRTVSIENGIDVILWKNLCTTHKVGEHKNILQTLLEEVNSRNIDLKIDIKNVYNRILAIKNEENV